MKIQNKMWALSVPALLCASILGCSDSENDQSANDDKTVSEAVLSRVATVPLGAEVTGVYVSNEGDLFFNVQHPSDSNGEVDSNFKQYNKGTVGVVKNFNLNDLPLPFVELPVPNNDRDKQLVKTAYGEYQVLGQNGDTFGGDLPEKLGNIYNLAGDTLLLDNNMPDFNGFISTGIGEGYLFTNWEDYPGGMSRLALSKNAEGEWTVSSPMMVDFSEVKGTAANCFGSVSPWGTPLSSEEWIVNSAVDTTTDANWNNPVEAQKAGSRLQRMWQLTAPAAPNPYDYGYIVEITNPTSTNPQPVKHFAMGRYEHENSTVMPDGKTVYLSQDDTGGVLFKFIADTANDLSAGTLYGAKLTQDAGKNDPNETGFDVQWIELAHGENAMIAGWIEDFNGIGMNAFEDGKTNFMTVADVEAWARGDQKYPAQVNGGSAVTAGQDMDDRAAFLESRQAARQKGATAEWRKLEGISINQKRAKEAVEGVDTIAGEDVESAYVYMAIADLGKTLTDDEGDIQLDGSANGCGGIYRAELNGTYDITRIEPVIMGGAIVKVDGDKTCDTSKLAQPDNVIVLDDGRLLIGEDGVQTNNTLWMYQPAK